MGYRSDVVAVFYTHDANEFPAMKLFIDENVPEWFKDEEYMRVVKGSELHVIKFTVNGVKWYPSYPDIQGFERMMDKFDSLGEGGDKWAWEFVRLGEEVEDVEEKSSPESENLLYVVRNIECDY